jgi:hypothetical protein
MRREKIISQKLLERSQIFFSSFFNVRHVEPCAPPFESNSYGLLRASRYALSILLKKKKNDFFPHFFGRGGCVCVLLNAFVPVRAPATHHWLMMSHPALFGYSPCMRYAACAALRSVFCVSGFSGFSTLPFT